MSSYNHDTYQFSASRIFSSAKQERTGQHTLMRRNRCLEQWDAEEWDRFLTDFADTLARQVEQEEATDLNRERSDLVNDIPTASFT